MTIKKPPFRAVFLILFLYALFRVPPNGLGKGAGVIANDETDYQVVQFFHDGIGNIGVVMGIADAGMVGHVDERTTGKESALTTDIFAQKISSATKDGTITYALFCGDLRGLSATSTVFLVRVRRRIEDVENDFRGVFFSPVFIDGHKQSFVKRFRYIAAARGVFCGEYPLLFGKSCRISHVLEFDVIQFIVISVVPIKQESEIDMRLIVVSCDPADHVI